MLDLGLVDPLDRVGLEVEFDDYDQLRKGKHLQYFENRRRRDSTGGKTRSESGFTYAQLIDPATQLEVGPRVGIYVSCEAPALPSRVGVVFFHRLIGCKVKWNMDLRRWTVEFP